jgi:probable HAF family extracellular repeat protein
MKNKIQGLTVVLLMLLTLSAGREVCATLLDLGTLGGTTSNAWAVKSDGTVVVGSSLNATAQTQAFLWTANPTFTSGTMSPLNFLSGGTAAEARAINTVGLVAGYSRDGLAVEQAVTWSGVTPTAISNTLGGSGARAFGVSTSGDVVGWARNGSGVQVAFVAVGGVMTALDLTVIGTLHDPTLGHNERALGISPDGRYVVGEYDVDDGFGTTYVHAFVYDRTVPANSYEFSSGGVGSARATNGTSVVGTITNPPNALAAFGGVAGGTDFLPQLAGATGIANGINASGVIGGSQTVSGLGQRAVIWDSPSLGATVTDLNDLHATANTLTEATSVADLLGIYTGNGTFSGQTHGFLMVIPEPGTLALCAIGGVGILAKRRRSKK